MLYLLERDLTELGVAREDLCDQLAREIGSSRFDNPFCDVEQYRYRNRGRSAGRKCFGQSHSGFRRKTIYEGRDGMLAIAYQYHARVRDAITAVRGRSSTNETLGPFKRTSRRS